MQLRLTWTNNTLIIDAENVLSWLFYSRHFHVSNVLKTFTMFFILKMLKRHTHIIKQLECGPMANVMAALPNIGGALCSTPQSLTDAHYSSAVTLK